MYPTLSDLLYDLFGWDVPLPIQTYGLMVALAFLLAGWTLILEFKRKESEGLISPIYRRVEVGGPIKTATIVITGLIGFVLAYKFIYLIANYQEFVRSPQQILLSLKGSWIGGIGGAVVLIAIAYWDNHRQRLDDVRIENKIIHPHQYVVNILMIGAVMGVLGSKLFHHLENLDDLIADPMGAIFSLNGLSFYGGLIVAAFAINWYVNRQGIRTLYAMDIVAPALILGYGIGRWGCQLSGDGCWGINNPNPKPDWLAWLPDWLWAYDYPHNILDKGHVISDCALSHCHALDVPVYPTPLYESAMALLIFAFLWAIRKRIHIPGMLFAIYLVLSGIERFMIEKIRINNVYHIFGREITQAEIISAISILLGLGGAIALYIYRDKIYLSDKTKTNDTLNNNE